MKTVQIYIAYLFFFLSVSCSEQQEIHFSKTIQFEGKIYLLNSDDPFTGILYNNYPSGQREYEGYYKKGQPNGKLTYFFENGIKMREGKLKDGCPVGKWTYYNQDESIKELKEF